MLEAKVKDQGHRRKCSPKKRSSKIFFSRYLEKSVFQKIFQAHHKLLTTQKIVLSSSRAQGNFRRLEASRPKPRTSKCVLEAKDILDDSTSVFCHHLCQCFHQVPQVKKSIIACKASATVIAIRVCPV